MGQEIEGKGEVEVEGNGKGRKCGFKLLVSGRGMGKRQSRGGGRRGKKGRAGVEEEVRVRGPYIPM